MEDGERKEEMHWRGSGSGGRGSRRWSRKRSIGGWRCLNMSRRQEGGKTEMQEEGGRRRTETQMKLWEHEEEQRETVARRRESGSERGRR